WPRPLPARLVLGLRVRRELSTVQHRRSALWGAECVYQWMCSSWPPEFRVAGVDRAQTCLVHVGPRAILPDETQALQFGGGFLPLLLQPERVVGIYPKSFQLAIQLRDLADQLLHLLVRRQLFRT